MNSYSPSSRFITFTTNKLEHDITISEFHTLSNWKITKPVLNTKSFHYKLHAIPALGKPMTQSSSCWRWVATLSPFLTQFCWQLWIRSSSKLLNAADWTLCIQKKDQIACIPVVQVYIFQRAGIIVRNTFWKFLFRFLRKKISSKSNILKQLQILVLGFFHTLLIKH